MLALILDRAHSCLVDPRGVPFIPLPAADAAQPLRAVRARFAAAGVTLPAPAGSRARADGAGRDFVFVTAGFPAPPGMSWRPLRDAAGDDRLWSLYVACVLGGWEPPVRAVDVWSFGDQPEMAARLAHLVACGEKRVTMGWVEGARKAGVPLAVQDGVSVVTDGFGYPRLVVRSVEVREIAFDRIDAATAAGEGEGDLSHADWREGHEAYFRAEAARLDLSFTEKALLSVERFEVLHVVGRADR